MSSVVEGLICTRLTLFNLVTTHPVCFPNSLCPMQWFYPNFILPTLVMLQMTDVLSQSVQM
jgi:hypothetical protein